MKVQEGDYVDVSGMDAEQRKEVVQALLDAGVGEGEWFKFCDIPSVTAIGKNKGKIYHHVTGYFKGRKLTLADLRDTEWNGEGLPPIGCEVEATWGCESVWLKSIVLDSNSFAYLNNFTSAWRIEPTNGAKFRQITVKTEAQRLSESANIKLKTAQKVIDAGYRKESV